MEALINELSDMIYHIARGFTNNQDLINELYIVYIVLYI